MSLSWIGSPEFNWNSHGIDKVKEYRAKKLIYVCHCGRGEKIKDSVGKYLVDVDDHFCVHCKSIAKSYIVPKDWNTSMTLCDYGDNRNKRNCYR